MYIFRAEWMLPPAVNGRLRNNRPRAVFGLAGLFLNGEWFRRRDGLAVEGRRFFFEQRASRKIAGFDVGLFALDSRRRNGLCRAKGLPLFVEGVAGT